MDEFESGEHFVSGLDPPAHRLDAERSDDVILTDKDDVDIRMRMEGFDEDVDDEGGADLMELDEAHADEGNLDEALDFGFGTALILDDLEKLSEESEGEGEGKTVAPSTNQSVHVLSDEDAASEWSDKEDRLVLLDEDAIDIRDALRANLQRDVSARKRTLNTLRRNRESILSKWEMLQGLFAKSDYDAYERAKDLQQPKGVRWCFYIRPDGTFVRLACPVCGREDFGAANGFLHHCRTLHHVRFLSLADAALSCGIPVKKAAIPPDDPVWQLRALPFFANAADRQSSASSSSSSSANLKPGSSIDDLKLNAIDAVSVPVVDMAAAEASRFHVKQRVLCGSTSVRLPKKSEDGETHRWLIYVRAPNENLRLLTDTSSMAASIGDLALAKFIRKVRFFIHPSFKPEDIVEVNEPPFQIIRQGWGEFPVRIQIHFHPHLQTRPVNIIHNLTLTQALPGLQFGGGEEEVEIELNRRGVESSMSSTAEVTVLKKTNASPKRKRTDSVSNDLAPNKDNKIPRMDLEKDTEEKSADDDAQLSVEAVLDAWTPYLEAEAPRWPLISDNEEARDVTRCHYRVAKSAEQWTSWSKSQRTAAEYLRAHMLKTAIELTVEDGLLPPLRIASLVRWLRARGLTPPSPIDRLSSPIIASRPGSVKAPPLYGLDVIMHPRFGFEALAVKAKASSLRAGDRLCRYCGRAHSPKLFKELETECGAKLKLSSSSTLQSFLVKVTRRPLSFAPAKARRESVSQAMETPIGDDNAKLVSTIAAEVKATIPEQDAAVSRLLWQSMIGFASSLAKAVEQDFVAEPEHRREKEGVIVPRRVYKSILQHQEFEWLSNQGLEERRQ